MTWNITVALIAAGAALMGGLIAGGSNYLISRRALSRSGARLLADLQILEKARSLQLDASSMRAIEARVCSTLEWHTRRAVRRSSTEAKE